MREFAYERLSFAPGLSLPYALTSAVNSRPAIVGLVIQSILKGEPPREPGKLGTNEVYYRYPDCLNRKLCALTHLAVAHLTAKSHPHPAMPSNTWLLQRYLPAGGFEMR
jgi:hypothetical protein